MSDHAFDQKNQDDFVEYSQVLNEALLEIQNNKNLKATVAQLSKMTGVHRNTIANRIWPVQKLKQIKEARKLADLKREDQERRSSVDKKALLESQLSQARKEVIYWFNEFKDMERSFEHSDKRLHQMREARDHYKNLYETGRKSLLAAEQEIERLKDLLELR